MFKEFYKFLKMIVSTIAISFLVACGQPEGPNTLFPLIPGTKAVVTSMGYQFEEEVLAVEGNIAKWETRWKSQVVSSSTLYRGVYPVEIKEENYGFINEIETEKIDTLFPLEIGKEISFEGFNRKLGGLQTEAPIWVLMSVREKSEIELKDGKREVFVIDITTDTTTTGGVIRELKTLWYSEELGLSVKKETRRGDNVFLFRVLELTVPDSPINENERRRSLGTILI